VLLHQLGEDLVLALELLLERGDGAVLDVLLGLAAFAGMLEGGGAVVEELLLPELEEVHGEVVLLAEVGGGLLLQQVQAKQGDFLLRGKVTALPSHGCSSARVFPLIPTKANSYSD
jgi:hypothetical protein